MLSSVTSWIHKYFDGLGSDLRARLDQLSTVRMKPLILVVTSILLATPVFAGQHLWDFNKDKPWWKTGSSACPGEHNISIWHKELDSHEVRYCVDKDSIVRLPNGGRARFIFMSYYPNGAYTSYKTEWYEVDCKNGMWKLDTGYSVQTKPSESYYQIAGRPGWYEFIWQGRRRDLLNLDKNWQPITEVGPEDKYFCPGL